MTADDAPAVDEDLTVPPIWATDPDADVPIAYFRLSDTVDKFRLGHPPRAAAALVDRDSWRSNPETLVGLAAGAWKALVHEDCDRAMAELIAKGWVKAAARAQH